MHQKLEEIVASLRKTIDVAALTQQLDDEGQQRVLHRALAMLWSAHDEITTLQQLSRRSA